MTFSPDSAFVAVAFTRDTVRLLDAPSGRELATLEAPEPNDICDLAFSGDGCHLAVMYANGPVHVWDLRLIRSELAAMNLDWDQPPYPKSSKTTPKPNLMSALRKLTQ
jgi:WD40 repeat protein